MLSYGRKDVRKGPLSGTHRTFQALDLRHFKRDGSLMKGFNSPTFPEASGGLHGEKTLIRS